MTLHNRRGWKQQFALNSWCLLGVCKRERSLLHTFLLIEQKRGKWFFKERSTWSWSQKGKLKSDRGWRYPSGIWLPFNTMAKTLPSTGVSTIQTWLICCPDTFFFVLCANVPHMYEPSSHILTVILPLLAWSPFACHMELCLHPFQAQYKVWNVSFPALCIFIPLELDKSFPRQNTTDLLYSADSKIQRLVAF